MAQVRIQYFLQETALGHQLKAEDCIYIAPDIPYKKRLGAQYYLPEDIHHADILLVLDDTVFGSAKAGLTLTEAGLYYRADFSEMRYFPFHALHRVDANIGMLNHDLILNQQITLNFVQPTSRCTQLLAQLLNGFIQGLHGKNHSSSQGEEEWMNDERAMSVLHACQLLKLDLQRLNSTTLKQAYRKQIADFHPDLYQQLPTAVQALIADHAQQLNQARDLLYDQLKTSE